MLPAYREVRAFFAMMGPVSKKRKKDASRKRDRGAAVPSRPSSPERRFVFLVALGLLLALAATVFFFLWRRLTPPRPRHVVLVSIDTLRADHLGCYGYDRIETPNIDRLASESVVFENAATAVPLTMPSHSSLFTGRSPLRHGVIDNLGFYLNEDEQTLAEVLRASGYRTGGFVGAFVLDSTWGVAQGFDEYFDEFGTSSGVRGIESSQRPGNEVLEPALAWIRELREEPFFAFIHFFDPHTPYAAPPAYRDKYGDDDVGRYDGEIAFVDSLVGKLLAALDEMNLSDDTLVVLWGDHGESLRDHAEETHGFFIYDATIRIPLIIHQPGGLSGARVRAQVRSIDVMPTILDLLGIDVPSGVEGVSLHPLLEHPGEDLGLVAYMESQYARLHFHWAPLRGLRTDRYKFIEAPRPELYDLDSDPAETHNLTSERAATVDQLSRHLAALSENRPSVEPSYDSSDPETEARLRALGYITFSGASAGEEREERELPDPKEKIGVFNRVTQAMTLNRVGDFDPAVELLDSVIAEDPEIALAHLVKGNVFLREKAYARAEDTFQKALERDPRSVDATYGLALAFKGQGRWDDAAVGFERCLELDSRNVKAAYQLAEIRLEQGRPLEAEKIARGSLELRPETSLQLMLADALLAQEKRPEALAVLQQAEREASQNALVHLSLGNFYYEDGKLDRARDEYEEVTRTVPRDPRGFNALGNVLVRKGDAEGALAAFRKAVELDPNFARAQNNLGIALAQASRDAEAAEAFQKAIESDPSYAEAFNNLGFLRLKTGAVREAIPLFRKALALKPDYAQARASLEAALRAVPESE